MTRKPRRLACLVAATVALLHSPAQVVAQQGNLDLLGGGGIEFPGDIVPRGRAASATGAITWWFRDRWGIAGWYAAVQGRDGRWFDHMVRPSIRYRRPLYDGRATLYVGISPLSWTDVYPDTRPGVDLKFVPLPVVDAFVGVPVSSAISVQIGGHCFFEAFLPTAGVAWTF